MNKNNKIAWCKCFKWS